MKTATEVLWHPSTVMKSSAFLSDSVLFSSNTIRILLRPLAPDPPLVIIAHSPSPECRMSSASYAAVVNATQVMVSPLGVITLPSAGLVKLSMPFTGTSSSGESVTGSSSGPSSPQDTAIIIHKTAVSKRSIWELVEVEIVIYDLVLIYLYKSRINLPKRKKKSGIAAALQDICYDHILLTEAA